MFNINELLNKVRGLRNSEAALRLIVQKAVKEQTGLEVTDEQVQIKGSQLSFKKISSSAKNEIFMKKGRVIEAVNTALSKEKIKEVVFY